MKWTEAKVMFDFDDPESAADLISNVFYEFGLQGVVIESPIAFVEGDWAGDVVDMPAHDAVIGYFRDDQNAQKKCEILEKKLERLKNEIGLKYRLFYSQIDESDWAESWKAHFWPTKVSAGIVVKPTWRDYSRAEGEIVLEIDPGMAFGTGTHPTTALCIELIEAYLQKGDSFLDVGTGSGILMVAAAKLGAVTVHGVDNDDMAVNIAGQNLLQNRIDPSTFKITTGNLVDGINEQFNLIAANISSDVILKLLDDIRPVLAANGTFTCSGIVEDKKNKITEKMKQLGFKILKILKREGWSAIAAGM
jgi:ribosomal protein L11 methyltransferase